MQLFIEDEYLQLNYNSIKVIHENNLSSFVPKVLFKEENLKDYITFNNKTFNNDFFTYDSIANQEMNVVFIPYVNINNFLIDQFGSFIYKHSSSILVENLINYFAKNIGISFYVNVVKTHFEIIVSNHKKLLYYNTFNYLTDEDFIYYILFAMEQLKLDPERVNVQLLGDISLESSLYNIIYKYIKNVYFLDYKIILNKHKSLSEKAIRENFSLYYF